MQTATDANNANPNAKPDDVMGPPKPLWIPPLWGFYAAGALGGALIFWLKGRSNV